MELFQVIALLCQIGGNQSKADKVLKLQANCQRQLVSCVSQIQSYESDKNKLTQCLVQEKLR